jgi:hypothetical protein
MRRTAAAASESAESAIGGIVSQMLQPDATDVWADARKRSDQHLLIMIDDASDRHVKITNQQDRK